MLDYVAAELERGTRLSSITRHMTGLMNGRPGARLFPAASHRGERESEGAGLEVLKAAIEAARRAEERPARLAA